MFKGNILLGVGANNYNFVVQNYVPPDLFQAWVYTVHSEYLLRLSETGILGFLLFYTLITIVVVTFYRATFTKNHLIFLVACGFFASMIGSFIHRLASMYHYQQFFMLESTIFALCALIELHEKGTRLFEKGNI
jgi:O-antigen ligase